MFDISMVAEEWIEVRMPDPQRCCDCRNVVVCEHCYVAKCEEEAKGLREMLDRKD